MRGGIEPAESVRDRGPDDRIGRPQRDVAREQALRPVRRGSPVDGRRVEGGLAGAERERGASWAGTMRDRSSRSPRIGSGQRVHVTRHPMTAVGGGPRRCRRINTEAVRGTGLALAAGSPDAVSPMFALGRPPPEPVDPAKWIDRRRRSTRAAPEIKARRRLVARIWRRSPGGRSRDQRAPFAVGRPRSTEGIRDGAIWFSADGSTWSEAGDARSSTTSPWSTSRRPTAFVAVGTIFGDRARQADPRGSASTAVVVFRSVDGAGGLQGEVAAATTRLLAHIVHASGLAAGPDGGAGRRRAYGGSSGIGSPYWTGQDWIAAGVIAGPCCGWRREPPGRPDRVIATDVFGDRGARWPWGRDPVVSARGWRGVVVVVERWSDLGPDDRHGISGASWPGDGAASSASGLAWASPDGSALAVVPVGTLQVNDATVLIAWSPSGRWTREDGSTCPLIAGPPLTSNWGQLSGPPRPFQDPIPSAGWSRSDGA